MEEEPAPDIEDSVLLDTEHKGSLLDGKAESNAGVRKSSRPRKQSKRSLDSAECEDDELVGIPLNKKHRKGLKVRTHRRKDILQNGRPFKCSLCQSQYINNCPAKAKIKREVQPIVKEKFGQLLQLCVKCAIAVNHTENKGPTPEQRAEFEEEGKQFAQHLVKYLGDPAAARLYCSFYQTTRCGCIQCYITGTQANRRRKTSVSGADTENSDTVALKGEDGGASTDDKADQTERAQFLLGLLKESMAKKQAQNTKASNDKSQQVRSESANVMKESEKFILENRMRLKELGICERGCQKVLCYSNNFLHKKSFGSQPRLQRTKGRAALGRLHPLEDLCNMRCCEKNCVKLAGKNQATLADWRQRAQGGQKEMWKVLEEMLTFIVAGKTSCYKFICMVTGCCLTTVQKVYAEILLYRGTTGCPSQKEHGMIFHWKRQKEQGKLLKVQTIATVQGPTQKTESQVHTYAAVCDTSFVPTLVADNTGSSAHVPDVKKEQKAQVVMMTHMAVSSQAETEPHLCERVAEGKEDKQDIKEKFLQLFENIKDPQEIANMQIILAELQRNLIVKQEKEHAQKLSASDVYTSSPGSAATNVPSTSSVCFPSSTPLALVPAISQTSNCASGAASKGFSQIVLQEPHLAAASISKTGRPFVHIKVPKTVPEQKPPIHQILQVDSKEQAAATATSRSLHMFHTVQNSTLLAKDSQVVDNLYSVQADTTSPQHLIQQNLMSRLSAEPVRFSAQPRTSTPATSGSSSRSFLAKTPTVTVSSENSFNQLSQQVGVFQVVTPPQTEASKSLSRSSQMLSVYPQTTSLQIQPLSLPPSTNSQSIQFQFVSPLILGQPNFMIQPGNLSFILQKPATDGSQDSQSFLQAPTLTSSSSISHKDFVVSHVSPMQNFPASAHALSASCETQRNKCLSTFPSQTECNLTFSNNTCNIQYSKSDNTPASSNSGVKDNAEAAIQNLQTSLDNFSESAEPHNNIASRYETNRNSIAQDGCSSSQSTNATVVHFQGIQACGQDGELLHQVSNIEQYFPSALLNQAAGNSVLAAAASSCSSSSFVFDALAESPVKDASLLLSSPSLHPVPIVTPSLLCEMLMSSVAPSIVSPAMPTTSQTPVYTVNSHSSRSTKPSLLASLKPSPSASAYCQSINFNTHTTPSSLSTQPVIMASKVEQTSLPIAVTIGHNASLSHSQISVSRLNRQRDPPQVGIVHPHVSGGKAGLGEAVNSHACSSASSLLSHNSVYSSSVASNVLGGSQTASSSSGLLPVNNSHFQVSTSAQELPTDILSNQTHPQQQQLLLSLLLNSQNANLPKNTLINIPQCSQFNLSALLGNSGANTPTANDSHQRQTGSSSQNENAYDFQINSQNIPNPSLQNTVIDNGNFLQSQPPLSMGSLMPVSIGNQNIVSGNAGTQLPICDPHMPYSNTGHVKLVPIILSDGSHGGSSLFSQNGQLVLNMSPCAGLGNLSSFSPQSLNRDSSILLNLSPSSGQNMQHHQLLQIEDIAQTTSALPLASPSSQSFHQGREAGVLSKDQARAIQASVLQFTSQHANNQLLAQIELQRDSSLSQRMSSKEPLCTRNVENTMSFYASPGLLRPAVETAHAQKSHSDLSCSQSILSSSDADQNEQDDQSRENPSSGQNVLIPCNVVQVSRSGETPHKITEAAGTMSTSLLTSRLTETKSSFTNTAMSEQHHPSVDSVRENRHRSQVYLLNQTRSDYVDQQSQLQSTQHATQQLQLPLQVVSVVQTPTEQTNSDRLMASGVGTNFVLGQPTSQNFGLGQQLHSLLSMSNPNQIFLPIQSVPFSSHSSPGDNISQTSQELRLVQQLSELYKPSTVKTVDASSSVPATQSAKNVSTHITCTSLQSAVVGAQPANTVASSVGSSKHRPIRPKLRAIPAAPASKISLMLVPDKPGYPAYQLTQVDSAALPFQQVSEQSIQSPLVSQQPQNVLLNPEVSLQKQNSVAGASKQQNITRPLVNSAFVTQLQLNQQSNVPAQILLLSQSEPAQRVQNSETQAIIGHQNEILTIPSEQMNTSIHALSLGEKRDRTVSLGNDIPEMISQQIVSIQPGHFQVTSDCNRSGLTFLQNETIKFSSADCESIELRPFENKEYDTGIFSNESVFVNTSQGTFSADNLRSDTFEVNFEPGPQQTHTVQFGGLEANAPGCSTSQAAVSQFDSLSLESSQVIPVQQLVQTDIQRLNPQIASQLSSGDTQRLTPQMVSQLSSGDTQRLTPQIVSQISSGDTQRLTPQMVSQLSSGDTQRLTPQMVSQLSSGDTQRLTPQMLSQLSSGDTQRLTPQMVSQLSSGDTQRLTPQMVSQLNSGDIQRLTPQMVSQLSSEDTQRLTPQMLSQLSSGDIQRLAQHNLVHMGTAGGFGDLVITAYKGSQILQISQPESLDTYPDVTLDTSSSSGIGQNIFTHSHADVTVENNNRIHVALDTRHVASSTFNNAQKREVKASGGSHLSTAMISNHPVTSSDLPVYPQFYQKQIRQFALMLDSDIIKVEDTKPALEPIQYLQCKEVIDLTEEDSPPLSPNSMSMNKGKTVSLVSVHSNPPPVYENLQKQIFPDNNISGQKYTISVPFPVENLIQQNPAKEGVQQQCGQLKQEGKEMRVLQDHILSFLTEGPDFNLSSGVKKEHGTMLKLQDMPEDVREVLLASLENHAAGNPDVHMVTKAFTPSDDLSYHSILSHRDKIHSVTYLTDRNSYPSNVVMMSSNQHAEQPPARSQIIQPVAVPDSKLRAVIHTQPQSKKLSHTRRSGTSTPSPGLNSLPATKLPGQLKQEMDLAFTVHESAVSTSSLSLDATATSSLNHTSPYVASTVGHKLAAITSCPPLVLTTLNTMLPRSPSVKPPLNRTVIHPLTSSTVAFIRTNNTPTEAVGPPNVTIMSSTQASSAPHLRLRHENSVSMTTASSNPLIISNISPKPVATMAKNHSSRLLKINSIPPMSAPAREQGIWDMKLSEVSCAASEGKDKAASQSGRRLSFENQRCQKEVSAIEASSSSLSVGSLLKPPEALTPCRPKGRKKPSTIMDLLKNKERLQATASALASSSLPVNSTTGPVTFMISGNPDLLLMDASATRAGMNSATMNIAVKNLQLHENLTSNEDTNCTPKQIPSSSQPSGFAILHPNILPSISGSCNIGARSTHITATEKTPSTVASPIPSVSQSQSQVNASMTTSRPQKMASPAEKSGSATPNVSSFTGAMSQPNILSTVLTQPATLSSQVSASFYRSRNAATDSGEGYSGSHASAKSSVQNPDFKHTHLDEVAKSDTQVHFQPIGQPQVASSSFSLKDLTQKPQGESFNGEKLKFKTTAIRNTNSADRQQELISNKFQLLEDTRTNLPSHSTGTIKKLLLLNEKPGGYNSKSLSDSLLSTSTQISDHSQQHCTNEKQMPQKSPQLLQLMKSKQSVPYPDFEPAVNAKLSHSSGHDKFASLKLPNSSASLTVSGDNLVYDYSSAHLSYNQSKEDFRQKEQLHVFKTMSSVPVLQQKESKMGLLEASNNIIAMEESSDSRMNLLPSQHPLLATILFTGDTNNTQLQPLPSESPNKSLVHFENLPKGSGKKRGYDEGNSYNNDHTVLGHPTLPSQLEHLHGSKGGKHIHLSSDAENTVSGLSSFATREPPAYNYPPRYEITKKDMTRVNRVIEDIYKFPDEGEEPSPPPVFGGLKSHKFTYTHRSQERATGVSSTSLAQPSENSQFSVASNKKSSPKTVQNMSGNSAASSGKSYASGNPQTWRSPKKLKAKRDQERSNCKINLKKVQFSDVVTSKSAPEYGQSATVNPTVDAPPTEPVSNQQDTHKFPVQEYAVEDSRLLLGKHERLEKDRQDNQAVYQKHSYTTDQLETEFREGKGRTYHPGLTEAAFARPENMQVNNKNKASKTLGLNTIQRETDIISDFETDRQFGREVHKVFQHQHLASVSHTAATADGEQKCKHRGEKDMDPLRQAHDNPGTFPSGFVQESLDTMYSFVNERTETGRVHNILNTLKPCEQTAMPGTFEGMSSQFGDMIHNKVEDSRDLTKRRHVVQQDDNLQFSADPDHDVHSFERNNYLIDKKEPPPSVATTNCDRDSTFNQQSSFNILSTQGYSKLSRQRLHRADSDQMWAENLTPAPFKPHGVRIDETGATSDHYDNRDFSYQVRCEPLPVGSEFSSNAERQPTESPLSRQRILESNFEIARQMKRGHVRILKDSRSETSEERKMESPQKFFLHPERSEDVSGNQMQRDTECQMNKDPEYQTLPGPASKLTSPIFSNNVDGRPDLLTSLESLSCLRKEIKDLKGENHYLKLEVARAEQKGKEQQRQRKLSTTDKQRATSTEMEKTEKSYYPSSSMSSQSYAADTETVTPIRKRHTSSTASLGALNYSLFPSSEQLKLEDSFQSKVCQLSSGSSGIQQMFDPDMPFPDSNHRGSAADAVYTRSSINIDDSPEHYIRDSRDPLVSSSMSSHSRPTSQLDLGLVQYDIPRHKYPFSEVKSGPLRSISDGDGFVPLQEHTRHRNLSSSLGFHVLSDVEPPSYEITQRQRNPSASSLKSAFQEADLNFDMGVRSRNPSSSSWVRYLDYGTDFTIIRSRNPSGSSNRRSRPGSSSSSERDHPVNIGDDLPLFSDIGHTRSRNSSGESIEPTLDHIIDPQQFMQYTQYTYQSAEAHSKRTKH